MSEPSYEYEIVDVYGSHPYRPGIGRKIAYDREHRGIVSVEDQLRYLRSAFIVDVIALSDVCGFTYHIADLVAKGEISVFFV